MDMLPVPSSDEANQRNQTPLLNLERFRKSLTESVSLFEGIEEPITVGVERDCTHSEAENR